MTQVEQLAAGCMADKKQKAELSPDVQSLGSLEHTHCLCLTGLTSVIEKSGKMVDLNTN